VLYLLFSAIQIVYLFIGNMQLPAGVTYAEYARRGFFQLLFVCVLNLAAVLSIQSYFKENRVLKALLLAISGCTLIMTASSACRMLLYIRAYQLTFLRVSVLVALAVIALLMAGDRKDCKTAVPAVPVWICAGGSGVSRICLFPCGLFYRRLQSDAHLVGSVRGGDGGLQLSLHPLDGCGAGD